MEHNTRHRANKKGHTTCVCRYCATPGGEYKKTVKRTVTRAVRYSESREIINAWMEATVDDMSDD